VFYSPFFSCPVSKACGPSRVSHLFIIVWRAVLFCRSDNSVYPFIGWPANMLGIISFRLRAETHSIN